MLRHSTSITAWRYSLRRRRRTTGLVAEGGHVRVGRMRRGRPTWSVLRWHLLALRSITGILLLLGVVTRPSVMMRMMKMPSLMLVGGGWPWMTGRRRRSCHADWSSSERGHPSWTRCGARNNIGCTTVWSTTSAGASASGLVLVAVLRSLSLSKGSTRRFGTTRRFGPR